MIAVVGGTVLGCATTEWLTTAANIPEMLLNRERSVDVGDGAGERNAMLTAKPMTRETNANLKRK